MPSNAPYIDVLFARVIKHRNLIVRAFKIFFLAQTAFLFIGGWSVYSQNQFYSDFYVLGRQSGEMGLVFFVLSSLPGIFRRFGIRSKLISILMIFRRYIGITCYLLVLIHSGFMKIIPWIARNYPVLPMETFVIFGVVAHILLFTLFVTSNDYSIRRFGVWWDRIHDLTYVIVWIIFMHVLLQGISIWSVFIGCTAAAQISSHVYARRIKLRSSGMGNGK